VASYPRPISPVKLDHRRPLYLVGGVLCFILGVIGYVVPIMPGTVFIILSLYCFKKSSPRLERWLLERSVFRGILQDWEVHKSMRLPTKVLALSMVWITILVSISRISTPWVIGLLLAIAVSLTWLLAIRIPTRKMAA